VSRFQWDVYKSGMWKGVKGAKQNGSPFDCWSSATPWTSQLLELLLSLTMMEVMYALTVNAKRPAHRKPRQSGSKILKNTQVARTMQVKVCKTEIRVTVSTYWICCATTIWYVSLLRRWVCFYEDYLDYSPSHHSLQKLPRWVSCKNGMVYSTGEVLRPYTFRFVSFVPVHCYRATSNSRLKCNTLVEKHFRISRHSVLQ